MLISGFRLTLKAWQRSIDTHKSPTLQLGRGGGGEGEGGENDVVKYTKVKNGKVKLSKAN